ncbi:hypothetical protein [Mycolicibacterium goodii]|uniref:hypothetical protein n=1 Tax=Mycolicibacterium goodii TaxID=134601 RepID=UPI000AAC5DC4
MDLFDVVRSCARRWYVFVPLLAMVTWFSYSAYTSVQPVYYSNAVIGLAAPSSRIDNPPQGIPIPRNGLLDVGGASLIANMTTLGLQEPAVVDRVVASGGLPDYSARMFPGPANMQQLPLIMIEATTAEPDAASKTLELVVAEAEATTRALQQQANVPDAQMVVPFVVSPPSTPAAGTPARTRSTLTIFVAGLGLTVVVTVLVDVLLSRRTRRSKGTHAPSAPAGAPVPGTVATNGQPETVSALTSHGADTNGNDRGDLRPQ